MTLHWLCRTANSAARLYYEHARTEVWLARPEVPTGVAVFAEDLAVRRCAERCNTVVHRSEFDRGGHFAALEEPGLLAGDVQAFFSQRSSFMSAIVLVPGAGFGAWAWSRVTPRLRAAGHDAHPITLTGTGDRAHLNHAGIDLSVWVTDVVALLETEELEDVVLVGHSFCGNVISGVAERAAERLARMVYLDAQVPRSGESAFAVMGPAQAGSLEQLAEAHNGWSLPWFSDEQLDQFYGGHGLAVDDLRWIRRHATAQPIATYRQALTLREPPIPRTFVRCSRHPAPPAVTRDVPGWDWTELDAGHWPMITAPHDTADLLDAIGRASSPSRTSSTA